jgi:flagellar biosynthetic protein FlhB
VLFHRIALDVVQVLIACLPLGVAVMIVALASPMLVGGWLFSGKAFMPNLTSSIPSTASAICSRPMRWSSW